VLKAVLFDLDGTLVDSEPGILASLRAVGEWLDRPLPSQETLRRFLGPPLQDWLPLAFGIEEAQVSEAVAVFRREYSARGVSDCAVYPGVRTLITDLRNDGLRLAVATSKTHPLAERMLTHVGLRDQFDAVQGATPDGTIRHKEQVVRAVLDQLRLEPGDVLLVGDREQDVLGARRHGVGCIGAAWGYGGEQELRNAGAIAVVDDPTQVTRALARYRDNGNAVDQHAENQHAENQHAENHAADG
jgi:phosphoglycolate phosphatase